MTPGVLTKFALTLFVIGAALWGHALTLPTYKDQQLFTERYEEMAVGQSEEYWKLRDEMLTAKFKLEDYGITLVAIGFAASVMGLKRHARMQSPKSRKTLIALALALPSLSVAAYVFDLFQEADRGAFPWWADSLGIPLIGAPIQLIVLLIWSLAHLGFVRGRYAPSIPLIHALSFKANPWLLFVSVVTALLVLTSAAAGQYWYAIPGALWLYYYLSLAAVRRRHTNPTIQGGA